MKGSAQSDLETNFRLRGVVLDFAAGLSEQSAQTALPANTRTELSGRLDLPGDAQVSRTMPVLHQFRAGLENPAEGTATASLDDLAVLALSQLTQYEGEYAAGSIAPDGARMRMLRDRFGRTCRILDPSGAAWTLSTMCATASSRSPILRDFRSPMSGTSGQFAQVYR
ncbi:hypothetical protein ABS71_19335 [bacterium SCN 62-11]|nr:hypothetical protein [Candidatus Eremiobacteraeota bacterium]ODT57773.1 MAG: hypothetical protein ABS71_19335 [bacterium SCN 62-11]